MPNTFIVRWYLGPCAVIVALSLVAPHVHAAPGARAGAAPQKKLSKRAQAQADAAAAAERAARAQQLKDALEQAASEREEELGKVQPLIGGGSFERAAKQLVEAALTYSDPILYLEAAEQFLAAADRHHVEVLSEGRDAVEAARVLLKSSGEVNSNEDSDVRTARVALASVDGLLERGTALEHRLKRRAGELQEQRHGRRELAAGAAVLTVGLTGVGVLAGGLVYRAARKHELAGIAGRESEYDLRALDAQGHRSDAMIGVGTALAVTGVVVGATLLTLGARDFRGPAMARRARLQVAPTVGGMVLSGRF